MVKIIYGKKGSGKSKLMVDTANGLVGVAKGNVVFIDDDNYLMYQLRHEIRFINISEFPVRDSKTFLGFLCGSISQNYDIDSLFVDGLTYFIHEPLARMIAFFEQVETLSDRFGVHFHFSINGDHEALPEALKKYESR